MLVYNRLILGVVSPSVFPWAGSVLMSLTRTDRYNKCYTFSHPANNLVFNLSPPRALGSSKGGLLWEINLDRSIFPKKNKYNSKAVSFFFSPLPFAQKDSRLKIPEWPLKRKGKQCGPQYWNIQKIAHCFQNSFIYVCTYIYTCIVLRERVRISAFSL